ncbi:MAG: polysaccharide deacetylase family protein [Rubrivivax sp.]|nr:polysaccharide deacetylase family protein [Rubrivivax sp.]
MQPGKRLAGAKGSVRKIKRKAILGLQRSLHYSGVARLDRRFAAHEGFIALMYHSIPDAARENCVDAAGAIPAQLFERQLQQLQARCTVISLRDALRYLDGEAGLPRRAVVLTFDDGYLDNLEVAAPLLRKYGMPATLFLATGYVDRAEPQWVDELHFAFTYRTRDRLALSVLPMVLDLTQERTEAHARITVAMQLLRFGYARRRELLDEVIAQLQPSRRMPRLTLNWDDARRMRREYPEFELGLHTHDHIEMATLPVEDALAEVRHSQDRFQAEMGYAARYFSYPYGRCSMPLIEGLAQLGIEAAFRTQPTERITPAANPWALPRYEVNRSMVDLKLWSEGALPDLGRKMFGQVVDQA